MPLLPAERWRLIDGRLTETTRAGKFSRSIRAPDPFVHEPAGRDAGYAQMQPLCPEYTSRLSIHIERCAARLLLEFGTAFMAWGCDKI